MIRVRKGLLQRSKDEGAPAATKGKLPYLFKEVEVHTISLLLADQEIPLLETGGDGSDVDAVAVGHDSHFLRIVHTVMIRVCVLHVNEAKAFGCTDV